MENLTTIIFFVLFIGVALVFIFTIINWWNKRNDHPDKVTDKEEMIEGKGRDGQDYWLEFMKSCYLDIKTTYNAAKITVPYLELMEKVDPDTCACQIFDETTLPCERETLKNAFKFVLESKDSHSAFNMPKQEYNQLALTHYLSEICPLGLFS